MGNGTKKDDEKDMIQNIIFDMVGVLMRFDTEGYYLTHGISSGDRELLQREVFRSLEWAMQDRGSISDEDAITAICTRIPIHLHVVVRDFIRRENRDILPIPGMEALLRDLKATGFQLYLLSNTSKAFHRIRLQIPGIRFFDGEMISADVGLVKPDPAIFRLACERFGIRPSESVFIDDTPINAEAAQHIGMTAFVFHNDIEELRAQLNAVGMVTH